MARYLQVFLLGYATIGPVASETPEVCDALGFDDQLQCGTCDEMKNFDLPGEIHDTCTRPLFYEIPIIKLKNYFLCKIFVIKCCREEEKETIKKYTSAKLIICQWKINAYPQIKDFCSEEFNLKTNKKGKTFKNLEFIYVSGSSPIIKAYEDDGVYKETIDIKSWDQDTIKEFLNERLE